MSLKNLKTVSNITLGDINVNLGYGTMFKGCTSLETVGNIITGDINVNPGYSTMFAGCTSLTTVGNISATKCLDKTF